MPTKKTNKSDSHPALGLALAAAAAAGIYFLYGSKDAKKNREVVKGWALKAKGEVLEKMEAVKGEITEENYNKIVDGVMDKYKKIKKDHQEEIDALSVNLKEHWKSIKSHLKQETKVAKKATKKATKKAVKKVAKKLEESVE